MQASANTIGFTGIGTEWEIELLQPISADTLEQLTRDITECVEQYDQAYSRFRKDSILYQLSERGGTVTLPDHAETIFSFYRKLYDATNGKVTPLIGNVLAEAGYNADYSLRPQTTVHQAPKWDDILTYEHPQITLKSPVIVDLGAAGKGHLVDIIGDLLRRHRIDSFIIDASGDILHAGPQPLRIGLEHPTDSNMVIDVVKLQNQSICGSASNRRAWGDLHHIMDPDLAEPVNDIIATWAIADDAMTADGLATALFFMSGKQLQQQFNFEYFVAKADMSFERSANFS